MRTEPAAAHVAVDGQPAFDAPGRTAPLAPGKHLLVAHAEGLATESFEVEVRGGEELEWKPKLEPAATVEVSSTPPGAQILVDGKPLGQTTPATVAVRRAGKRHALTLRLEGHASVTRSLPNLATAKAPLKVEVALQTVQVVDLRAQIATLEKQARDDERRLKDLEGRVAKGAFVANARKELALRGEIEELEIKIGQANAELGNLREELERQQAQAAP